MVFACAWWAEDVAYGSGTVGASTGVGQAAAVGSVAGLARFSGRDKKFRFLDYLPLQRVERKVFYVFPFSLNTTRENPLAPADCTVQALLNLQMHRQIVAHTSGQ